MNFPPLRDPANVPTGGLGAADGQDGVPPESDEPLLLDEQVDTAILGGPAAPVEATTPTALDAAGTLPKRDDEPIPMLTEVVQVARYEADEIPDSFAEVDWGDLAQKVRENVLERLLRRSDALLDTQIQATLTPVLERAAEAVAQEMHDAMTRMIRDIVARAVTEELTRLHAEIARRNRK